MPCCARCGREVYYAEQKIALNKVWHTFCFSCYNCRKLLDSCSFNTCNGELYCNACYRCLVDPRSSYMCCRDHCWEICEPEEQCNCPICNPCQPETCDYLCEPCEAMPKSTSRKYSCRKIKCCPNECATPKCKRCRSLSRCSRKPCGNPCANPCCNRAPSPEDGRHYYKECTCSPPIPRDVNSYYSRNHEKNCPSCRRAPDCHVNRCAPCTTSACCTPSSCTPSPCTPSPCNPSPCTPTPYTTRPCTPRPCSPRPCSTKCCTPDPCTSKPCSTKCCTPSPCAPRSCSPPPCTSKPCHSRPCTPTPCCSKPCFESACCSSKPCKPMKECLLSTPCPPRQCGDPTCASCCNSPKKPICYPPVKCCEPCPPERICFYPPCTSSFTKCCCTNEPDECCYSCTPRRVKICCVTQCCTRCGQKVYIAEMIKVARGAFHNCCFTCYCCNKQLEVSNFYENRGEIYCKFCYAKLFGVQGYGYGAALSS